eukprot:gnl/MRDRNA2_/MRDRNA2_96726_c0_seq1.p1 gnl/MRDRNA2_/MRDRNA2_96726_c0~~gnl/MRDRNA2_/MRDRNA2_96726_c0_seq1.p1  ORF type:complete len:284 (-),score=53.03 gnl/MRDRNA2_/MRDRNA2_96726_c0_seq1:26-877(-)
MMMKVLIGSMFICAIGIRFPSDKPALKNDQFESQDGMEAEYNIIADSVSTLGHGTMHMTMQAIKEFGKPVSQLSEFAKKSLKLPKSLVDEIIQMKNTSQRTHRYNFVGRMAGATEREVKARQWAVDFAKTKFSEEQGDVFITTATKGEWTPLGTWDKTSTLGDRKSHVHKKTQNADVTYDHTYWNLLATSQFTLCPGGDDHFSFRAYEAILAGSICVVKDYESDWRPSIPTNSPAMKNLERVFKLFKYVEKDQEHKYDQSMVDHNLGVFIKYLTYLEGDNTPP